MVFTILIWETRFRHLRLLDNRLCLKIPNQAVIAAYTDLYLNFSVAKKLQSKVIRKDTFRFIGLTLFYVYNRFCIKKGWKSLTFLTCVAKINVAYLWNKLFLLEFYWKQTILSRNGRKWFFFITFLELSAISIWLK